MSSSLQQSSRSLFSCLKPARRRPTRQCSQPQRFLQKQQRCLSSFTPQLDQQQQDGSIRGSSTSTEPGRWSRTPPAMAAPIRAKPYPPNYKPFPVNKSPDKLDAMYAAFLGKNGSKMLSDETKWLAVTHKSFDHGRRGFNDRLAFLGKRILELQCSLGLLTAAEGEVLAKAAEAVRPDEYGRQPFTHPALANVEVLSGRGKEYFLDVKQIAAVAGMYGIPEVVRWQPRDVNDLTTSGAPAVYAQAVLAIIGALSLEQGGAVASRVARERVLQPSGLKSGLVEEATQ
ncbi:hypothetical protein H2198_007439 [Neophaeococcomyces mojaviensis]|uniref:Uncharacterized protein n=1 Tax=Neophaeococcomyces mojaviensis TaxID=3383035 RepID=A0ACC2ZZY3_9EURO|nr:hypothetical protein H2198_007439 [Knufia sp. JES_112]